MNSMLQPSVQLTEPKSSSYSQLGTFYDEKYQLMWYFMHASPRPCFTPVLLNEIRHFHGTVVSKNKTSEGQKIYYIALASDVPGVFNLGGDLNLFRTLIQTKDRNGLLRYTTSCIDALHANICHLNQDITTISLVQGDALGGGFESALSSNVLIAERSAKMGMPEILFNLFPGMGAYSLLSRKVGVASAERTRRMAKTIRCSSECLPTGSSRGNSIRPPPFTNNRQSVTFFFVKPLLVVEMAILNARVMPRSGSARES